MRTQKSGRDLNVFLEAGETVHHRKGSKLVTIKNKEGSVIAKFKAGRKVRDRR